MLADALANASSEQASEGVFLCRFSGDSKKFEKMGVNHRKPTPSEKFELFFCCKGSFVISRKNCADEQINRGDIILLADIADQLSVAVQKPVTGYSVLVCTEGPSPFKRIYQALDFAPQWYEPVQHFLDVHNGYFYIRQAFWKQGIFSVMQSLPDWDQPAYCVLKAAELFYLLSAQQTISQESSSILPMLEPEDNSFSNVGMYIEKHLDEKLTIPLLCHRFNLSPTTLKNKFREVYGQPIHSWISACRLQRAAELLQFTDLKIIQIAQYVGYESASQFNVIFRRAYGTAPTQYRKNVRSNKE